MTTNRALQRLIKQQERDRQSEYAYPPSREKTTRKGDIDIVADIQAYKHQHHEKISWGQPAQVAVAKIDHCCPVCGSRHANYEGTRLIAGISRTYRYGELAGALCAGGNGILCDWSFADLSLVMELEER